MSEDIRALNVAEDVWRAVANYPDDMCYVIREIPERPTSEPRFVVTTDRGTFEIVVNEVDTGPRNHHTLIETFFESGDFVTIKVQVAPDTWVNAYQGGWESEGKDFLDTLTRALKHAQQHPKEDVH